MRKIVTLLLVFLYFVVLPQLSFAHMPGQPPFFKINDKYSDFYPVQSLSVSSPEFELPQDIAPENYVVNEPIEFEIDTKSFQAFVPEEIVKKTKFIWDFGNGAKGEGLKNTHIYKKIGSYVLTIDADTSTFEKGVSPQVIQSVLLRILPDKNYQMPKAVIRVNGKEESRDPKTNVLENAFEVNLNNKVKLEVSLSGRSNVTSYFWDLGDGETSKDSTVEHQYKDPPEILFPAVRIRDKNGFIVDTSVGLRHNVALVEMKSKSAKQKIKQRAVLNFIF